MDSNNRSVVLARRPDGNPVEEDFRVESEPLSALSDGQFLCRNHYVSLDAGFRNGRPLEGLDIVFPADGVLVLNRQRCNMFKRQLVIRNLTQHHRDVAFLSEDRDTKTGHLAKREAKVGTALLLQLLLTTIRRDTLHQGRRVVGLERLGL